VAIYLENKGLSGLNFNNLNIVDSASDGLGIICPGNSALSSATFDHVNIPNYGLGVADVTGYG